VTKFTEVLLGCIKCLYKTNILRTISVPIIRDAVVVVVRSLMMGTKMRARENFIEYEDYSSEDEPI
jgi:hypothetical protein